MAGGTVAALAKDVGSDRGRSRRYKAIRNTYP